MAKPPTPLDTPAAQPGQRIAKLLARAGIASRREIERMIAEGRVALNGAVLTTPATVLASLAGVTVDGKPVEAPAPARLFLFHKPNGVLVTERDPKGRRTIYDVLPADLPRLMPVGRLDLNTEGLLLLTTDGELKRQLELPATGVERAYRARAYGQVTQAQLEDLIDGVEIEGVRYGPIDANLERRTGANVWVEMILTEGKNREVRRVLEHLGLQVSRLIRTRYGPFLLGDLAPGEIGEVRQVDVIAFRRDPRRQVEAPPALKPAARHSARAPARPASAPEATPPARRDQKPKPPAAAKPARPPRAKAAASAGTSPKADPAKPRPRLSPKPAAPGTPPRPPRGNRKRRPGDARPSRPRGR